MKNHNRWFTLFLLTVMFTSLVAINANNVSSNTKVPLNVGDAKLTSQSKSVKTDYVIFAQSKEEYKDLLASFDVKASYDNLKAVVVPLDSNQIKVAKTLYGNGFVFPLSDYSLTIPKPNPISNPGQSLTGLEDIQMMGVSQLYDLGYNGTGINIGIIDNGIYLDHPALKGKVKEQVFVSLNGEFYYHGTSVAGMIVTDGSVDPNAYGSAVNASIYSVALPTTSSGGIDPNDLLNAYNKMLEYNQTIDILSLSLGGPFPSNGPLIKAFTDLGILVVAAAGNEGPNPGTVGFPGGFIDVVAVGATDHNKNIASFSSRGPTPVSKILKPDVVAPGQNVYTATYPGDLFGYVDGTSFSTPVTSGALATLASALNANNITWNMGTLKAALLRGAEGTDGGNYDYGMGFVNIYNSYTYLMNIAQNGTAKALAVTPLHDRLFRSNYLSDIVTPINGYTVVSSHPAEVSVSVNGSLADILFFNQTAWDNNAYSQEIPLYLNSTGASVGSYSGFLIVQLDNQKIEISITYEITGPARAIMGFDLRHTDWDDSGSDRIGGTNTGGMIDLAMDQGVWVEEFDEEITSDLLSRYDIVWIPDPVEIGIPDFNIPYEGEYFLDSEITALENYVDNGGNLLFTFNGLFTDTNAGLVGTNATELNRVIGKFGALTSTDPSTADPNQRIKPIYNVTSFVGSAKTVTTFGNFLSLDYSVAQSKNAALYYLTGTADKTQIALYDQIGGGRVIISDNNFWTDNGGTSGAQGYSPYDRILAQNAYKWFLENNRVSLESMNITDDQLVAEFSVYDNGSPSTQVSARRLQTSIPAQDIPLTDLGNGRFRLVYNATEDGVHNIQVTTADDYLRFTMTLNLLGPTITPLTENETVFGEDLYVYKFEFEVVDSTYKVTYSDLTVILDGTERPVSEVSRIIEDTKVTLIVQKDAVDPTIVTHNLTFIAKDDAGNEGKVTLLFYIGEKPVTSTPTSSQPTNQTTSETTSETSSVTSSEASSSPSPISQFFVLALFASAFVLKRKISKKSKS